MKGAAFVLALLLIACGDDVQPRPVDAGAADAGSRLLGDQAAVDALATTERVFGDLVIGGYGSGIVTVDLPALREVQGDVVIKWSDGVTRVALPNLARARDVLVEGNGALATIELPALSLVRSLTVSENARLSTLALPSLTQLGSLDVANNAQLARVSVPALTLAGRDDRVVGGVRCTRNPRLVELDLPRLAALGELSISGNTTLPALSLPALTKVDTNVRLDGEGLRVIGLPELVSVGELSVRKAYLLTDIDLRSLATAREIGLSEVASLRSLSLPKLRSLESLWISEAVQRIDAPELTSAGGPNAERSSLPARQLRFLSLPKLKSGCDDLLRQARLPECALATSLPMCPREGLDLVSGCTCAPDGDLQAARCPDDAGTPWAIDGGLDGGVLDAG
jgi:hypothetical protein